MESKKRSANFTPKEEAHLLSLVKKYKTEIECKKSDKNTNKTKAIAWQNIAAEYNSSTSGENSRDVRILRNKYENLKKRSKQKFADEKAYVRCTGGGPSKTVNISDSIDNALIDIVGAQITGLKSEFDDDGEAIQLWVEKSNNFVSIPIEDEILFENEEPSTPLYENTTVNNENNESTGINDWSARKNALKSRLGIWPNSKTEVSETQKQIIMEEHHLKLKHMEEKHQQQMKFEEAEHKEKLLLLQLQQRLVKKQIENI